MTMPAAIVVIIEMLKAVLPGIHAMRSNQKLTLTLAYITAVTSLL